MQHYYAVIMAGGIGTRLWPLSRQAHPKQVLPLVSNRSMFKVAVDRLQPLFDPEMVFVVAGSEHADLLRGEQTGIPERNFIIEPAGRGTAPAIGLSAIHLRHNDQQAVMAVLTADHFIGDESGFRDVLQGAYAVALQDHLVTLGIAPSSPSTGYGYIERGQWLMNAGSLSAHQVLAFHEKPDLVKAKQFVTSGRYSWNSGMFVWRASTLLDCIRRYEPALGQGLMAVAEAWETPERDDVLVRVHRAQHPRDPHRRQGQVRSLGRRRRRGRTRRSRLRLMH